jgi:hypothetical protein
MFRKMAVGFAFFVGVCMLGLLGTGVSVAADKTIQASFINSTDGDIELFLLDNGKEVSHGVVQKGTRKTVDSRDGHVWIVRGTTGRELERCKMDSPEAREIVFRLAGPQAELPKP